MDFILFIFNKEGVKKGGEEVGCVILWNTKVCLRGGHRLNRQSGEAGGKRISHAPGEPEFPASFPGKKRKCRRVQDIRSLFLYNGFSVLIQTPSSSL